MREAVAVPPFLELSRGRATREGRGSEMGREGGSNTPASLPHLLLVPPISKPNREPEQSILGDIVHRGQPCRTQHKLENGPGGQTGSNKHAPVCD